MLRDYTEQIRYNERQIMKPFSERSLLEKIGIVIAVVSIVLLFAMLGFNRFTEEKADNTVSTEEQSFTVSESGANALIEESISGQ